MKKTNIIVNEVNGPTGISLSVKCKFIHWSKHNVCSLFCQLDLLESTSACIEKWQEIHQNNSSACVARVPLKRKLFLFWTVETWGVPSKLFV